MRKKKTSRVTERGYCGLLEQIMCIHKKILHLREKKTDVYVARCRLEDKKQYVRCVLFSLLYTKKNSNMTLKLSIILKR